MAEKIKLKRILTGKEFQKFIDFLEDHKKYMGFSDWDITLGIIETEGDHKAEVCADLLEKQLKIGVKEKFIKYPEFIQKNILFHELVHARVSVFSQRYEELKDAEEEYMVNDIVRGFERFSPLKFRGEK